MMRRVGGRDDDQIDGPGEQLVHVRDEVDARIARVWRAVALHDGVQAQTRDRADDRGVEDLAGEAETDESDVEQRSIAAGGPRAPPQTGGFRGGGPSASGCELRLGPS